MPIEPKNIIKLHCFRLLLNLPYALLTDPVFKHKKIILSMCFIIMEVLYSCNYHELL